MVYRTTVLAHVVTHTFPSGAAAMSFGHSEGPSWVTIPAVVILAIGRPGTKYNEPSGPAVVAVGSAIPGEGKLVMTPAVVILSMVLSPTLANRRAARDCYDEPAYTPSQSFEPQFQVAEIRFE